MTAILPARLRHEWTMQSGPDRCRHCGVERKQNGYLSTGVDGKGRSKSGKLLPYYRTSSDAPWQMERPPCAVRKDGRSAFNPSFGAR